MITTNSRKMTVIKLGLVCILLMAAWLLMPAAQAGSGAVKERGRSVNHNTKFEMVQVGDVKGHIIGVYENKGLAMLDTGEIATVAGKGTFDANVAIGSSMQGYNTTTFTDGSTHTSKVQGTGKVGKGGEVTYKGTYEFISGSGRFQGIKGSGSWTAKILAPGVDTYLEYEGTYTLPSK